MEKTVLTNFLKRVSGKLVWQTPHFALELTPEQEKTLSRQGQELPVEGASVAIGYGARAEAGGVAIGAGAYAGPGSVSIGVNAGGRARRKDR